MALRILEMQMSRYVVGDRGGDGVSIGAGIAMELGTWQYACELLSVWLRTLRIEVYRCIHGPALIPLPLLSRALQ